jgi:hypothetical protein
MPKYYEFDTKPIINEGFQLLSNTLEYLGSIHFIKTIHFLLQIQLFTATYFELFCLKDF